MPVMKRKTPAPKSATRNRALGLCGTVVLSGVFASVSVAWFGAWDLATRSIETAQGSIIGAGGFALHTPLLLRTLRVTTPERWHAWPRSDELFVAGPTDGASPDPFRHELLSVGLLRIDAVCTDGLFDIVTVTRTISAADDHDTASQSATSAPAHALEDDPPRQAVLLRRLGASGEAVPHIQLSHRCLDMLELLAEHGEVEGMWLTLDGEIGAELQRQASSTNPPSALAWSTVKTAEIRTFGWPLRCLAVYGNSEERSAFTPDGDEVAWRHRSKSDGILAYSPIGDWPPVSALPATGLPWKPLWLPFLANSLILGMPLTLASVGVSRAARAGLAKLRGRGDRCARCGYPRKGLDRGAACPECGGG